MSSDTRSKALGSLSRWTAHLSADEHDDELDALRFLIARDPIDADGDGEPDAMVDDDLSRFLADPSARARELLADGPVRVARPRSIGMEALALGESLARSVLDAVTLGPFRDRLGVLRMFDVYRSAARLQVFEAGDTRPVMVLTSARVSRLGTLAIDLEPGTVWIRARKLTPTAPADLYVSLRVSDGKLRLQGTPAESPGAVTLPGALAGELELTLTPLAATSACGDPTIALPERATIRWSAAGVVGELVGGGIKAFGTTYALNGSARFALDPHLNAVVAETAVAPRTIDASAVRSPLGKLRGRAEIDSGGLALPGFVTTSPATLPEAAAGGVYVMRSSSPLAAAVHTGGELSLQACLWVFAADSFYVITYDARGPADGREGKLRLYRLPQSEHRVTLPLDTRAPGLFALGWRDSGGTCVHGALFSATTLPAFERPVDIVGRPFALGPTRLMVLLELRDQVVSASIYGGGWTPGPWSLAIENAVLRVRRSRLLAIAGTMHAPGDLRDGTIRLDLDVSGWAPTQPDPYVSSVRPTLARHAGQLRALARLDYRDDGPARLGFEGALGPAAVQAAPDTPPPLSFGHTRADRWRLPSQTQDGRVTRPRKEQLEHAAATRRLDEALDGLAGRAEGRNQELRASLRVVIDETIPRVYGPLFLDVSTHRHLIGVQVGLDNVERLNAQTPASGLRLERMRLVAPLSSIRVFTVPQIQWEPVRTLDKDQDPLALFPTPLASADDGGATVIGARSSRLAAVIPDLALTDMVAEQRRGRPMAVATTLPFGLAAAIKLRTASDTGPADEVAFVRPKFAHGDALEGGHQLSLIAGGPTFAGGPGPTFLGRSAQLSNGVDLASGTPLGVSVLGATTQPDSSVEAMFNREFTDAYPRVPVTRLDLSGYGASTFSDWTNPQGAFAQATKVQFRVMVGRTALEIIKFASIIYPWAIRVTRAVTIERKGGGGVIRRDSGWQASSSGLFDFRYLEAVGDPPTGFVPRPNPFIVHPGLIKALHNVARIRPASNDSVSLPGNGKVAPVFFDADVHLDGAPAEVRTQGMLGFLHLEPVGRIISNADLVALLRTQGGVGGPVDVSIDVAASGFRMRGLRVEAAATADGAAVVCAVRGAPDLRAAGAWSAVRMPGPSAVGTPPEAEPIYDGVPLIQLGAAKVLGPNEAAGEVIARDGTIGPYRFAEPIDLLRPTTPASEIAFVQATATHSFAFRRPYIATTGSDTIESMLAPLFADFFARSAFRTPMPPVAATILLDDQTYALKLGSNGGFRLDPSVSKPNPRATLSLSSGVECGRRLFYDDTTLAFAFDESAWSVSMPRLRMWADLPSMTELVGMRMGLVGGSATRAQLTAVETLYHETLADALAFIPGFANRGAGDPIDLAASNLKLQFKIAAMAFWKFPPDLPAPAPQPPLQLKIYGGFDFSGWRNTDPGPAPPGTVTGGPYLGGGGGFDWGTFGLKAGAELRGKITNGAWFWVLGSLVEIGGKFILGDHNNHFIPEADRHDKVVLTFKVFVGYGAGEHVGPFAAYVFFGAGPMMTIENTTVKIGGFLMFEAKVAAEPLLKIKVYGEFQCLFYRQYTPAPGTYVQYSGEVGINIEILFFSIKMSVTVIGNSRIGS